MLLIACIPSNQNLHDPITQCNDFEIKAGFQCKRIFYDWKGAVERTAMLEVKITSKSKSRSLHTESKNTFYKIPHSFLSKCMLRMQKQQKKSFRGSVQTCLTEREVVFIFLCAKISMCAMTLSPKYSQI